MLRACLAIACITLLLLPEAAMAEEMDKNTGWFRDFGLGLTALGAFQEIPMGREHTSTFALGPSLLVAVYRFPMHRIALDVAYIHYMGKQTSGTRQLSVTTSHSRLDVAVSFDFCWKALIAGLRMGTGLSIASTTTRFTDFTSDFSGDLSFHGGEEHAATGVNPGFLVGVTTGLNIGRLFASYRQIDIDLRIGADYFRHNERDDFTFGVAIVVWPMSIVRSTIR